MVSSLEVLTDFGVTIETDLADHGFGLLRAALALRVRGGTCRADEHGIRARGKCLRGSIRQMLNSEAVNRGFRRTIAASAYHLAGFSAVAYSLFNEAAGDLNLTPGEAAVMRLGSATLMAFGPSCGAG